MMIENEITYQYSYPVDGESSVIEFSSNGSDRFLFFSKNSEGVLMAHFLLARKPGLVSIPAEELKKWIAIAEDGIEVFE